MKRINLHRPGDASAHSEPKETRLEGVVTVALALIIAFLMKALMFQPFTIPSSSMEPTLHTGDYLVVSKFSYGWSRYSFPISPPLFHARIFARPPQRGDVIVFKLPRDHGRTDYVKRLIGLPGDRVQIRNGVILINGKALEQTVTGEGWDPESLLRRVIQTRERNFEGRAYDTYHLSPGQEGENTGVYVVPPNNYFFMGDNRDNSLDSRWPDAVGVGFVPAENLVGKVIVVLASWRAGVSLVKPWTWFTDLDLQRILHPVR
jgi:signal peptidase I